VFAQRHTFYDVFLLLLRRNEDENLFSFVVKCASSAGSGKRRAASCAAPRADALTHATRAAQLHRARAGQLHSRKCGRLAQRAPLPRPG
jgi:hypothetical protein